MGYYVNNEHNDPAINAEIQVRASSPFRSVCMIGLGGFSVYLCRRLLCDVSCRFVTYWCRLVLCLCVLCSSVVFFCLSEEASGGRRHAGVGRRGGVAVPGGFGACARRPLRRDLTLVACVRRRCFSHASPQEGRIPPADMLDPAQITRNILADKPRVTRFPIDWNAAPGEAGAADADADGAAAAEGAMEDDEEMGAVEGEAGAAAGASAGGEVRGLRGALVPRWACSQDADGYSAHEERRILYVRRCRVYDV